ncbi:hypothetical protein B0H14DRAFT_2925597 [Mycena olivaceomarginata]|nr:hypothetical protein B0H14DRAFT_2925597 [Mycena olivaceomarginata]
MLFWRASSQCDLQTLQLYHFEDYRTTQNLYIAIHRPPVVIFDNVLPALKNVSLIGAWDAILRRSPRLRRLRLHYSGPRAADGTLPRLTTLALDLPEQDFAAVPEQDFTGVVQMIAGVLPSTVICGVLLETIALPLTNTDAEETRTTCECETAGAHRGCPAECGESLPSSACSSSSSSTPWLPEDSTPTLSRIIIGSEVDFSPSRCGRAARARRCMRDAVLEQLDDGADDDVSEGYDSSKWGTN